MQTQKDVFLSMEIRTRNSQSLHVSSLFLPGYRIVSRQALIENLVSIKSIPRSRKDFYRDD